MDPLTFANQIASKQEAEPQLDRWAHKYLESSALQTLYAARFLESTDQDTRNQYIAALRTVLQGLPVDVQLEVSRDLFDTLSSLTEGDVKELLKQHVRSAGVVAAR